MIKFENYLIKEYGMTGPKMDELYRDIKNVLCYTMKAAWSKLTKRAGTFELLGCDIMLDEDMKPILIEFNSNPALSIGNILIYIS